MIQEDSIVVFDKLQATVYQMYGYPSRAPLLKMRDIVLESQDDEYSSWVDVISLSSELGIRGYGTRVRTEWREYL